MLTKARQKKVEERYQNLKIGKSKGISLVEFKAKSKEKYGL